MFSFKKFFLINILVLTLTNIGFAENKLAYLDLDSVFLKSNSGKFILKQLNELEKITITNLKEIEKKLKFEENQILSSKNLITQEELKKKIELFKEKIESHNKFKSNSLENFKKKKNDEISKFLNLINPLIKNYMKNKSITVLMDKKYIYIADSNYDITDQIIDIINRSVDNYKIK